MLVLAFKILHQLSPPDYLVSLVQRYRPEMCIWSTSRAFGAWHPGVAASNRRENVSGGCPQFLELSEQSSAPNNYNGDIQAKSEDLPVQADHIDTRRIEMSIHNIDYKSQ